MTPWLLLLAAIVSEIIATTALKASDGFNKLGPSLIVVVGYVAAFWLMSISIRAIPLNTAYAIWAGLGTAGAVAASAIIYREAIGLTQIAAIGLIIGGVVLLNVTSTAH